jgi:hypothetical protein
LGSCLLSRLASAEQDVVTADKQTPGYRPAEAAGADDSDLHLIEARWDALGCETPIRSCAVPIAYEAQPAVIGASCGVCRQRRTLRRCRSFATSVTSLRWPRN